MTVNPDYFVKSMCKRWEADEYGLTASESLKKAWHEMAVTFNDHIKDRVQNEWSVLHLPTGTGKTQGLTLYCSLLAEQDQEHPGVLVITRFTTEADTLVKTINKKPYPATAITSHTDMKAQERPDDKTMMASPVLVVTHSAYKNALDTASDPNAHLLWKKFSSFNGGVRKLIVIDETLDTINPVHVDFDTLRLIRGLLPRPMLQEHSDRLATFEKVIDTFAEWEKKYTDPYFKKTIEPEFWKNIDKHDIAWLRDKLCKLDLDKIVLGRPEKGIMKKRVKGLFSDLLIILSDRSWYAKKENDHSLNSGYVPLPTHISSAVIMDATASKNAAYDLLGSIPRFRELPDKSKLRSYKNVRLHVFYGYNNGSRHLAGKKLDHFVGVLESLTPHIARNKKFFLCTSMGAEKKLASLTAHYPNVSLGHWGAIDGKNTWQDYDTMVIYGLQRLDEVTPEYCLWAYDNWHSAAGGQYERPHQYFEEMPDGSVIAYIEDNPAHTVTEDDYKKGHLVTSVIQAINRIRCRKSIDDKGNCLPTDVYLLLHKEDDEFERAILDGIREEMPGIQIIENGRTQGNVIRMTPTEKKVLNFLGKTKKDELSPDEVRDANEIKPRTMDRIIQTAKDENSLFYHRMSDAGFSFKEDRGRYANPRFVRNRKRVKAG